MPPRSRLRDTIRDVPELAEIAQVFARYANTTFGGGSATIAVLEQQVVGKRGWIDAAISATSAPGQRRAV